MTGEQWKFQDNWIVLDVVNINNATTDIRLFDPNRNYNIDTYVAPNIGFAGFSGTVKITYATKTNSTPVVHSPPFAAYGTITSVVTALNAEPVFQENGLGIFSFTLNSPFNFNLIANSSDLYIIKVSIVAISVDEFFSSDGVLTAESTISLMEISQELVYQNYRLDTVDVFASNVAQANQQFSIQTINQNGTEYEDVQNPAVNPIQPQSALLGVKLDYIPTPTNALLYKMNRYESVRLIFKYSHISLDMMPKAPLMNTDVFENVELESKAISNNSIRGIVLESIRKQQLEKLGVSQLSDGNIKKIVAGYLV
jgi:hypothetical protein